MIFSSKSKYSSNYIRKKYIALTYSNIRIEPIALLIYILYLHTA